MPLTANNATFNRLYRERRLQAQKLGLPFPSYPAAKLALGLMMLEAERAGGVVGAELFWDAVFAPAPGEAPRPTPEQTRREREQAVARSARAVALASEITRMRAAEGARPAACEVCFEDGAVVYDHDKNTGRLRGWLCNRCKLLLGTAGDDADLLRRLAAYLDGES